MLIQTIGVSIGIVGFIINIQALLIIGGIVCIISDILGYFRGTLKLFFPIILYTLGYFIIGSWIGIFYGSIIGNAIEVIPYIFIMIFSIFKNRK